MTETVTVGVVDKIPIDSVHTLLRIDLTGGKAEVCPVVYGKPMTSETCEMSAEVSELYPRCVVTRSMAIKQKLNPIRCH